MEKVSIVKCQCGHPICDKHGLSYGDFYQGVGWSKKDAEEIAHRINSYEMMYKVLKRIAVSNKAAAGVLVAVDSKNYVI